MNEILLEFAGRQADAGATQLPESYRQLAVNAGFFLKTRMAGGRFTPPRDGSSAFRLNLKKGRIVFFPDGGQETAAQAQVIGTYSDDGSWMWAWGHPDVPLPMQQAAWAVQQFGERQEIEDLLSRGGPVDAARLAEFQAICAYISDADGVFMGPHGAGGQVAVCYYLGDQLTGLLGE
ncbi:hypothetical protein PVV74_16180 [Roseovarius sp. SK2]|jgi:hypothetical protein|uniref:DUF6882 domain-containing protein n=1 Tax=Roseovarius TaxID=74030 RepID=UPI000CDD2F60|nr:MULTISPECIES: DUF6882 domain-containing protein [Roseovarius]MDD9727000.1 hypothetical protein [Roseovarius sp. SK2]